MRMRVLAAFATPRSLQDLLLNKTLLSLLQERHQVRSARVRRHTVFCNLAPHPASSADILVPPCRQTPAQSSFLRGRLLMICAAKPRYTAAAAREHRRVLAPRLPTPGANVTSPLHTPREVLFEMCQRRVLLARIKGRVRQVQFCKWTTTIKGSLELLCCLTHSIIQARRCRRVTTRSRSLVSGSSRALATCPDVKGEGDTHVERCVGLHVCKLQRHCQGMLCFEVGDGVDVLLRVRVRMCVVVYICQYNAPATLSHALFSLAQRSRTPHSILPSLLPSLSPSLPPLHQACQRGRFHIDGRKLTPYRLRRDG
jgi:hypothetical protein